MGRHIWKRAPVGTKWCTRCNDFKPLAEFGNSNQRPGGKDVYCKRHRAEARAASRAKYDPPKRTRCPNCGHEW